MLRIQPLYALLFQQLVDLNSRSLPAPADRPTLVMLDEFARLGPAPVLAHAFAWVAGYGLRLLAVLGLLAKLRGAVSGGLTLLRRLAVAALLAVRLLRIGHGGLLTLP